MDFKGLSLLVLLSAWGLCGMRISLTFDFQNFTCSCGQNVVLTSVGDRFNGLGETGKTITDEEDPLSLGDEGGEGSFLQLNKRSPSPSSVLTFANEGDVFFLGFPVESTFVVFFR